MQIHPKIVYSDKYDITFPILDKFHPFDGRKYSKAWKEINCLSEREIITIEHSRSISDNDLMLVHAESYLKLLNRVPYILKALEMYPIGSLSSLIHSTPLTQLFCVKMVDDLIIKSLLEPMRLATMGTVIAGRYALQCGIAINLSGGYHHASQARAEGFCFYSDIAVAIQKLRQDNFLIRDDKVLIIDLDAHQGNGLERIFKEDDSIYFFDMYNKDIYPNDRQAKNRINRLVELSSATNDDEYMEKLKKNLDDFIEELCVGTEKPKLAFFNAGTDIYEKDPLGKLRVSAEGVYERDVFVFNILVKNNIPVVMVLSGGYTKESYRLIANSVNYVLETWR